MLEQAEAELKAATENLARGCGEPVKAGTSVRKMKPCASSCGTQSKSRLFGEPYFMGFKEVSVLADGEAFPLRQNSPETSQIPIVSIEVELSESHR